MVAEDDYVNSGEKFSQSQGSVADPAYLSVRSKFTTQ
jgi:hypothetical protein